MPTYDYQCNACEHTFEKFQSITARPIRKCPKCGKRTVKRLIGTGAGIIFKGSGFYQTDYRSEAYKKAAAKDKENSTGSEGKASDSSGSGDGKSSGKRAKADSSDSSDSSGSSESKDSAKNE